MREPVVVGAVKLINLYRRAVAKVRPWLRQHGVVLMKRAGLAASCLLLLSSIILPSASAWAAEQDAIKPVIPANGPKSTPPDTKTEMKQNYAGPLVTDGSGVNAKPSAQDLPGAPQPMGQALPDPNAKPVIQTGEIVDKRTAFTTQTRNADNTVTEKRYLQPINFQKDGRWEKIDSSLVEDKNAGDAGTPFGEAYGQVKSWFSNTTNYIVKDNDWKARFSPSDSPQGMVRVQKGSSQMGFSPVNAKAVAPVIVTGSDNIQRVYYYDLWPGVNVAYTVNGGQVKEDIILKDKDAANQLQFAITGASLEAQQQGKGGFKIKGAFDGKFTLLPINLNLQGRGPVLDATKFSQTYKDNMLSVSVDRQFLQSLPASAFPAVVDPGIDTTTGISGGGMYKAIRDDDYSCDYNTTPQCKIYVGANDDNGWWDNWRSAYYAPYTRFQDSNKRLVVAKLYMHMQTGPGYHGTTAGRNVNAYHALCNQYYNCEGSHLGMGNVNTDGEIDLTNFYKDRIAANDFAAWTLLTGEEITNYYTWKEFDPAYTYMAFTWGDAPVAPPIVQPGVIGQVFTDPQVSFKLQRNANPNSSTQPLKYEIRVSSMPDGLGTLITSGLLDTTQWTIPDNMLQDGTTYYVQARSYDDAGSGYGGWSGNIPFKIDARTGKDKTQTYDSFGAVDINLATGNVASSAGSHTSASLGGSLGVSLDYNSPVKAHTGLKAEFWNGSNTAGIPDMTHNDLSVDFDWGSGKPAGLANADNFSVKWSGYFVAPKAGTYYFGGSHDDSMNVKINNVSYYSSAGCSSSPCFGATPVSLTAGQVATISVDYYENTGNALAKLYVKGAVAQQLVPETWLRTAPQSTSLPRGLVGHYYFDDGSHNLDASNKTLFMQRTDTTLSFNWGSGAPVANDPKDNFMVRWTGYIVAPAGGSYTFGTNTDDGTRITMGTGATAGNILNQWQDQGMSNRMGSSMNLTAGTPVPITVDYYEHTGDAAMTLLVQLGTGAIQTVPTDWLRTNAQVVPAGWSLGIDPDGSLSYDRAQINQNSVVLTDSSGSTHEYTHIGAGAYKPPVNEDGVLVRNQDGTITLQDSDGRTYVFKSSGELDSVTSPLDDRNPAALQYTYSGDPKKIQYIRDGVDTSRYAQVFYSGDTACGSAPTGFDSNAPGGMLCAVKTNDNRATYFYYKNQQLARIAQPGNAFTDYDYDSNGRIIAVRDGLANDAIAAGVRVADATTTTEITYDALGRATSVKQPAATTGATRTENTIEYSTDAPIGNWQGAEVVADTVASTPVSISWNQSRTDLFARSATGTLLWKTSLNGIWGAWQDLGGCIVGDPAVTNWGTSELDVFVTGCSPSPLLHRAFTVASGWSNWEDLGGTLTTSPTAYAWSSGRFDVFAKGTDNTLRHRWYDGVWKGWESLGGCITGAPGVSGWAGHLDIFIQNCTGTNNLGQLTYDEYTGWQSWNTLAYHIAGTPSSTSVTTGRIDVTATDGTNIGTVAYNTGSGWGTWQNLGLCSASTPSISMLTQSRATLYTKGCESSGNNIHKQTLVLPAGSTREHVTGATEPNGFSRRIEYDDLLRTTKNTDAANLSTTQEWDVAKDLLYSTTDATGLKATTIYDDDDRAIDSYGPAPASYYSSDRKPTGTYINQVAHSETKYDEGITGTQVAWYNAKGKSFIGAPKLHTTGILPSTPSRLGRNFTVNAVPFTPDTGMDGYGFTSTSKVRFPQAGTYTLRVWHDDRARVWLDDKLIIDDWESLTEGVTSTSPSGTFTAEAGKVYRLRFDYLHAGNAGATDMWISGPGISTGDPNGINTPSFVTPGYNLTTSAKVYDNTLGNKTAASNYGANPELSLPQSSTTDPTGLNLTSATTYETQGATGSLLRPLTKTLPGSTSTNPTFSYTYYGATETRDNPCTTGTTEVYKQAGFVKLKTEADPDGGGTQTSRKTETIYDDAGNAVASRYNTDSWTCTYYDTRGRTTKTDVPAYNGNSARTLQNDYAVGGSPLVLTSWDDQGWIVTWIDLLGRTTKYRDVHDDETTTSYDTLGRVSQRVSLLGTQTYTYDNLNRVTQQKLDSVVLSNVYYDSYSRLDHVTYPNAGTLGLNSISRDAFGQTSGYTWNLNGGTTVSDTVIRTQSGVISTDVVASGSNSLWYTYGYDMVGRLTSANIGPHTYSYGYGTASSTCNSVAGNNTNAGKNGNRTTQTINGVTTTFCYDQADRLKSSSSTLYNGGDYDSHGNMTSVGSGTTPLRLCFDSSDRNTCMTQRDSSGNGIAMYYNRDVQGRITARFKNTLTNWTAAAAGDFYYGFTGSGDSPDFVKDQTSTVIEKNIPLVGGALLTIRPTQTTTATKAVYSLPNVHGDTLITADGLGNNTSTGNGPASTFTYDPFGNVLSGSTTPSNFSQGSYGWAGHFQKGSETNFALAPIQMGARVYIPGLGRFLQVDPVDGGTPNAYVYALDPVNGNDYSGQFVLSSSLITLGRLAVQFLATPQSNTVLQTSFAVLRVIAPQSSSPLALRSPVVSGISMSRVPVSSSARAGGANSGIMNSVSTRMRVYNGVNSAYEYYGGGSLAGGIIGCSLGSVAGAGAGIVYSGGIGAVPGASLGCITVGSTGARLGGIIAAPIGFVYGFTGSDKSDDNAWGPDQIITPW